MEICPHVGRGNLLSEMSYWTGHWQLKIMSDPISFIIHKEPKAEYLVARSSLSF